MRSYRREEPETNDLERWENEGGRIYKPSSERDSHGRDPKGWRMYKDSPQRIAFFSVVPRADTRTPPIPLRYR